MKKHTLDYADVIVGEELRKKREEKGFTLQQVADKMSLTRSTIHYYETGEHSIKWQTLIKICQVIKVNPYEILDSAKDRLFKVGYFKE